MSLRVLLIPIMFLLLHSCSDSNTTAIKSLYKDRGISFDTDIENCIILPEVGCGGCIAGGVFYILNHKESFSPTQKKNLIVFTAINSKKILFRDMEIKSENELYCILDTLNNYLPDGDKKIYPLVLKMNKGEIVQAKYQSPDTDEDIFKSIEL